MRSSLRDRKRYLFPMIHFLLSFLYERWIFVFGSGRDIVLPIPRNQVISDAAERLVAYVVSKLFAAILIFFLWSLFFWVIENWRARKAVRVFLISFAVCLTGLLLLWPIPLAASPDSLISYSYARRFWPEYWHGAYTGFLYAALLMVVPHPVFLAVFQLLFGFFVLGYLSVRMEDSPVLKGKGRYWGFFAFCMPEAYALLTNPYRTEPYALLCMFAVSMTAMDVVDGRKRGNLFLACNVLLCGFLSVWRTEGIILGFLLFLVQLLFVYRCKPAKAVIAFLCLLLTFGAFLLPQKLGDDKYYGKDYSFINSFPTLKNILASKDADLSYEGAEEDLAALEAVTPVELIRYYGMDGYRRYNYANGRDDINQSLVDDETASAYMRACYRIVWHNPQIYVKTQVGMLLKAIMVTPKEWVVDSDQVPVDDLPPWTLKAWEIGFQELENTRFVWRWTNCGIHQQFSALALKVIDLVGKVLQKTYYYSLLLIVIPLFEVFLFFNEVIRALKRKANFLGLAGMAFLLLGQAVAIVLVMPAGNLAYFYAYYYCSLILCLIYVNCLRCRNVRGSGAEWTRDDRA